MSTEIRIRFVDGYHDGNTFDGQWDLKSAPRSDWDSKYFKQFEHLEYAHRIHRAGEVFPQKGKTLHGCFACAFRLA